MNGYERRNGNGEAFSLDITEEILQKSVTRQLKESKNNKIFMRNDEGCHFGHPKLFDKSDNCFACVFYKHNKGKSCQEIQNLRGANEACEIDSE